MRHLCQTYFAKIAVARLILMLQTFYASQKLRIVSGYLVLKDQVCSMHNKGATMILVRHVGRRWQILVSENDKKKSFLVEILKKPPGNDFTESIYDQCMLLRFQKVENYIWAHMLTFSYGYESVWKVHYNTLQ